MAQDAASRPLRQKLLSGTAYTLVSVLAVQAISLVVSVAYARLLGPFVLGVLALVTQISAAIVPLSSLGLGTAITRMIPEYRTKGGQELERLLASALGVTLVAGVIVSGAYFAISGYLAIVYGVPELVVLFQISASLVLLDAILALAVAVVQGFQRVKQLAVVGIAAKVATVPVIIVMTFAYGIVGAVLAGVVSQVVHAAIYAWAIRGLLREERLTLSLSRFDRGTAKAVLKTAIPLFAAFIVMRPAVLFQASFLALVVGYAGLGLFRIAQSLYRIGLLLPTSLSVPLLPAISEMYAESPLERTRGQLSSLLRITAFLSLPITLIIGLGSYFIVSFLYGADFAVAAPLVFVISAAAFVDTLGIVVENTLLGTGRTKQVFLLSCMQAVVVTVATYVLVSAFGLLGIGFAILANGVVYATVVGVYLLRRHEIRFTDFRAILALAIGGFLVASIVVVVGRLSDPLPAVVLLVALGLIEFRLLSPRDRFVLKDAIKGVLGLG